jgi:dUTP pyrophosphatase
MAEEVVVRVHAAPGARLPEYATAGASGFDLRAHLEAPVTVAPGARIAVPTGLAFEIPPGLELQVRARSGLARSRGLTVLNAPGTVDADFRGAVEVLLVNLGAEALELRPGERIAQGVLAPVARARLEPAPALGETARGAAGFGSTGLA